MKITKFGHSCLLIEEAGARVLAGPGAWTDVPELKDLDAIVITHEHQDHFDIDKLKTLKAANPKAQLVTHPAVGVKIEESGLMYVPIEPGQSITVKGLSVESYGTDHAIIYGTTSPCRNTGYLIAERLFIPGDALHHIPSKSVEILALPTGGPWMKMSEAVDYAKKLSPKFVFPIHDAMYTEDFRKNFIPRFVSLYFQPAIPDTTFVNMLPGDVHEF